MRPKKLRKKLTLKKQTISHMEVKQQDEVRAGGTGALTCSCNTCYPYCGSFNSICVQASECGQTCPDTVC